MIVLFVDTETTGKLDFKKTFQADGQPDIVQLAACLFDEKSNSILGSINLIISPYDNADVARTARFNISSEVAGIHGISQAQAILYGVPRRTALSAFNFLCRSAEALCAHNMDFDLPVIQTAFFREDVPDRMENLIKQCSMRAATPVLKLPKPAGWKATARDPYKWPTLQECYEYFFKEKFDGAHNAMNDVMAMLRVWIELRKLGAI